MFKTIATGRAMLADLKEQDDPFEEHASETAPYFTVWLIQHTKRWDRYMTQSVQSSNASSSCLKATFQTADSKFQLHLHFKCKI